MACRFCSSRAQYVLFVVDFFFVPYDSSLFSMYVTKIQCRYFVRVLTFVSFFVRIGKPVSDQLPGQMSFILFQSIDLHLTNLKRIL